jgi:hypothetical protein
MLFCKIRADASYDGSKVARVLVPKVHINGKNNTRMEIYIKNQCLVVLCGD